MKRTFKDWFLATRPWSYPASTMPVLVTSCMVAYLLREEFSTSWILPCALTFVMMCLFQASGNLMGDYYDHIKGVDIPGSLNGVRHIQSGMFTPKEILTFGRVLLAIAGILGIIILLVWDIQLWWMGVIGILLTVFYPFLKYHALGDLDILICYALVPSIGTFHLAQGRWFLPAMLLSLTYGLMTVAILHVNNTRDIRSDGDAGAIALAGLLGWERSAWLYALEVTVPYLVLATAVVMDIVPYYSLAAFVMLPVSLKNARRLLKAEPYDSVAVADMDQQTAQMQLKFSLLISLGCVIGCLLG